MAVAKRQGREKPPKIEQRKVRGLERGPRVGQRAVLAGPVHTGQAGVGAAGGGKHKKRSQRAGALPSCLWGQHALMPQGCIFLLFSK